MNSNFTGARLDEIAKTIQSERRVTYSQALRIAMHENAALAREYDHGAGTESSPTRSYSVISDAGQKWDKKAKAIMERTGVGYREALSQASKELPQLIQAWDSGHLDVKNFDTLSTAFQTMLRALNDPDWVRQLAGSLLDHHATEFAGSNQRGGQVNPESYRQALQELIRQFPDLGEAADSGKIASDNWRLLSTLVPSVSSEVKSKYGADPHNLRSGNYSGSQGSRVYQDRNNNQYRRYDL